MEFSIETHEDFESSIDREVGKEFPRRSGRLFGEQVNHLGLPKQEDFEGIQSSHYQLDVHLPQLLLRIGQKEDHEFFFLTFVQGIDVATFREDFEGIVEKQKHLRVSPLLEVIEEGVLALGKQKHFGDGTKVLRELLSLFLDFEEVVRQGKDGGSSGKTIDFLITVQVLKEGVWGTGVEPVKQLLLSWGLSFQVLEKGLQKRTSVVHPDSFPHFGISIFAEKRNVSVAQGDHLVLVENRKGLLLETKNVQRPRRFLAEVRLSESMGFAS